MTGMGLRKHLANIPVATDLLALHRDRELLGHGRANANVTSLCHVLIKNDKERDDLPEVT